MDEKDIIYIAGLFDGEGSVGVYANTHGSHFLRVQVVQTELPFTEEILGDLQRDFGGSVGRSLSTSGKYKLNWQVGGDKAAVFLSRIKPWLRLKHIQAAVAIAWQDTRPGVRRGTNGRVLPIDHEQREFDRKVSLLLRALKMAGGGYITDPELAEVADQLVG